MRPLYCSVFRSQRKLQSQCWFYASANQAYFSASGLGSCWLGIPQPTKEVTDASNLEFIILMSFGNSKETPHRTSTSEFKRQSLGDITNIKDTPELLEPARLAPSAVNAQNWYFTGNKNSIHAYSAKSRISQKHRWKEVNYSVNMGIVSLPFAACSRTPWLKNQNHL